MTCFYQKATREMWGKNGRTTCFDCGPVNNDVPKHAGPQISACTHTISFIGPLETNLSGDSETCFFLNSKVKFYLLANSLLTVINFIRLFTALSYQNCVTFINGLP